MNLKSFIFSILSVILWTEYSLSSTLKIEDIDTILKKNNPKIKAYDQLVESKKYKVGHIYRSFIPDIDLYAGSEKFDSTPLGKVESKFYGVNASLNVFNGFTDYWKDKKNKFEFKEQKIKKIINTNQLIYYAKLNYLKIVRDKNIENFIDESIQRLNFLNSKVVQKVSAGVIAKSDITSIRLFKASLNDDIERLSRQSIVNYNNLITTLNIEDKNINELDYKSLSVNKKTNFTLESNENIEVRHIKLKSQSIMAEAKSNSLYPLPSIDIFANYEQVPYSEREYKVKSDRQELRVGIQAKWSLSKLSNNYIEVKSLKAKHRALENFANYKEIELNNTISNLNFEQKQIIKAINSLSKEIKKSKTYNQQVNNEYLRGVKSTSDLTSAYQSLLDLKIRQINLQYKFHVTNIEIQKMKGRM
ncbi:MAG: TolC family protein [Bdellovibrionales bacterium]|nr:TolC family protein [Bdellovibrionales bacterium]